jgi:hypothetical protein
MSVVIDGIIEVLFVRWLDDPETYPLKSNIPTIVNIFLEGALKK